MQPAVVLGQAHHQVKAAVAFDDLGDALAFDHLLQGSQNGTRCDAVACGLLVVQVDLDLRNQHLLLDLQVGDARNARQPVAQVACQTAQRVQVVAVHLQRNLCPHAREQVVQAVRNGLPHAGGCGQGGQSGANVLHHDIAAALGHLEVDVHLGVVHPFRMFVQFGSAGSAAHLGNLRNLHGQLLGQCCDAVGLFQRGAGVEQHVHRERAFVEGRQERARKEGHAGGNRQNHDQRTRQQGAGMIERPVQQAGIPALEPGRQRAVARMQLLHARQQVVAQHGGDGDGHHHAGQDGHHIGNAQGGEQAAFDAGQGKQGHKHQHHDQGGIDHARAHLAGGGGNHRQGRERLRFQAVFLQAAQHVFDVHHRVVHQLANGDGQPAQRHGVDRQSEIAEHQRGHHQRQRNGHQRDDRGAHIQQEQEQHDRHQNGAIAQGFLDVAHRAFDEIGLLEQELRRFNALGQRLVQCGHGLLDGLGERHAVGARLLLHRQDHGRLALVAGVAALDGRGQPNLGHLVQQDGLRVLHTHHHVAQVLDAARAAHLADQVFVPLCLQEAAARVGAKVAQRSVHLFPLDTQGLQPCRINLYPVLAHLSANGRYLGNARDGEQPGAHHPVGIFAHLHRADLGGVGGQGDQQNLAHDGRNRPHLRHDAFGQLFAHQVQALGNLLAVAVDVGAPLELDIHDRQPHAGDRAHTGHPGHAVHARLDGKAHQLFDLFGRHAAGFGHQRDGGLVQVGKHIDWHLPQAQGAVNHQKQRQAQHHQALAQARMDDEIKHVQRTCASRLAPWVTTRSPAAMPEVRAVLSALRACARTVRRSNFSAVVCTQTA